MRAPAHTWRRTDARTALQQVSVASENELELLQKFLVAPRWNLFTNLPLPALNDDVSKAAAAAASGNNNNIVSARGCFTAAGWQQLQRMQVSHSEAHKLYYDTGAESRAIRLVAQLAAKNDARARNVALLQQRFDEVQQQYSALAARVAAMGIAVVPGATSSIAAAVAVALQKQQKEKQQQADAAGPGVAAAVAVAGGEESKDPNAAAAAAVAAPVVPANAASDVDTITEGTYCLFF